MGQSRAGPRRAGGVPPAAPRASASGLPWRPSMLSGRPGCGKQLDDLGNAEVLVVAAGLVGSTAGRGGGSARVGLGAPGASAKGEAVPVVPPADLDNGAASRERYSESAVSASSSALPTPPREPRRRPGP